MKCPGYLSLVNVSWYSPMLTARIVSPGSIPDFLGTVSSFCPLDLVWYASPVNVSSRDI